MFTRQNQQLVAIMSTFKMLILDRPYIDLVEYQRKLETLPDSVLMSFNNIAWLCERDARWGGRSDSLPMHWASF